MVVEFDYSKLRGRIVEKFHSIQAFSNHLGIAVQTVVSKLNGKKSITFNDVVKWARELEIPVDDIGAYFFTPKI